MEALLVDIANKALIDTSWLTLLDAICNHHIELADALKAKNQGKLRSFTVSLNDPLIRDAVNSYISSQRIDSNLVTGFTRLVEFAGDERTSKLNAKNIMNMLIACETKYNNKRNTVYRKLYQAIGTLLSYQYGKTEKDRILADVNYKRTDDTREMHISPSIIKRLIQSCSEIDRPDLGLLIQLALITSADKGVLLQGKDKGKEYRGLLKGDIKIMQSHETGTLRGEVYLRDTKTTYRTRTVPLPHSICQSLLIQCGGKKESEPVFDIKYQSMKDIWSKARKAAGLWNESDGYSITFKDLRAQTAIYAEEVGIPQTVIMQTMGHASETMTRRYQRRKAAMSQDQVEDVYASMFASHTNTETNVAQ